MKQKVLIAGGSGFLGKQLAAAWENEGYEVQVLSRSHPDPIYRWNPEVAEMNADAFHGTSILVNLAGENVGAGRWTTERKVQLAESRLQAVQTLVRGLRESGVRPYAIGASGIAWYGYSSESQEVTEASPAGSGFLPQLTQDWENAYSEMQPLVSGLAVMRIGVVLHPRFGAYPKMVQPLRWGVGAIPGSGKQMISWIHVHDFVQAACFLANNRVSGVVNMCAPTPVSMRNFMLLAGAELKRPVWPMKIPAGLLKLILGAQAELVLQGAAVIPRQLLTSGYVFRFPDLLSALKSMQSDAQIKS